MLAYNTQFSKYLLQINRASKELWFSFLYFILLQIISKETNVFHKERHTVIDGAFQKCKDTDGQRELICKNNLSLKRKKNNAGFHFLPACLLMTKILCFCLQGVTIFIQLSTEVFVNGLKLFFFLCWLRNTCKPIRVDLH